MGGSPTETLISGDDVTTRVPPRLEASRRDIYPRFISGLRVVSSSSSFIAPVFVLWIGVLVEVRRVGDREGGTAWEVRKVL